MRENWADGEGVGMKKTWGPAGILSQALSPGQRLLRAACLENISEVEQDGQAHVITEICHDRRKLANQQS